MHDELVWEVNEDQLRRAGEIVRREMEASGREFELRVPLKTVLKAGPNWGTLTELAL